MNLSTLLLLGGVVVLGCRAEPAELGSCGDSLAGMWRTEQGDWALLDHGQTIDAFPQFDDSHTAEADSTLEVAPRVLLLKRVTTEKIIGQTIRRYMRGPNACEATATIHVLACHGTTLELTLSDPAVPLSFAPCTFSARMNPSRKETWRRVY